MSYKKWGARAAPAIALLALSLPLSAEEGIDQTIDQAVRPFADAVAGFIFSSFTVSGVQVPFVLVWLLFAAAFFTLYFRFCYRR